MSVPPFISPSGSFALLLLDAAGRVLSATRAAADFWQLPAADLAGRSLVSLLRLDIQADDDETALAQWEAIADTAVAQPLRLDLALAEEALACSVRLQLEAAPAGAPAAWFAHLSAAGETPARASATSPQASAPSAADAGLALLVTRGALGFFDLDFKTGRVIYSPAWKRLLGYTESELPDVYETWLKLIHPEDSAAAPDRLTRRPGGASQRNYAVEFRMRHRLGHYVWIQSLGLQLFGADGRIERVAGLHLDITERKELEEQGLANEERLQHLADDGAAAVFDLDFAASRHWFSPAWHRLFGGDPDDATTAPFLRALPENLAASGLEAFLLSEAPGEATVTRVAPLRTVAGEERPVLLGLHRQFSRRRELLRVTGFACLLPEGATTGPVPAALLEGTFASLGEAVILTDPQARILLLNAKAEQLTGWAAADARTQKLGDVFKLVHHVDGRPADDAVDLILAAEEKPRLHSDYALVGAKGGRPEPIIWTVRQAWNRQGGPAGVVIVFRNPQEMTLTPEEIVRANRFDSLGQLAGGIAHDFNNLLTTILGGISQAKENRDYSRLDDAENACLAAKALTRQLLSFAKGSAGATQQVLKPSEILRDAVRIASAGGTALVEIDATPDTEPVQVDRGQILQVFQNLIINALQAMPDQSKGRVILHATNVTLAEGEVAPLSAGPYVQFEVEDNGKGIPPAHLAKIFEPFFTTKKQGTGLGLATVLSIVRKHGGQIGVQSVVGKGTTFTVFLPKAEKPVEVEARRAPSLRFGTGRILLMDDDPQIADLTAGMLTSLDYTYDIAKNGEEAVTFYRRYLNVGRPYDAVILDLTVIGGMGGEDCFRQLLELNPEVRAIVNSGYDNDEMAQRFLDLGFSGYLTKPYRVGDLSRVIKAVLGKS